MLLQIPVQKRVKIDVNFYLNTLFFRILGQIFFFQYELNISFKYSNKYCILIFFLFLNILYLFSNIYIYTHTVL